MTQDQDYRFDVAFSFLKQDESIAFDINDRILDRTSTFIYSKKQEELGGSDGEKKFNKVFYEEARIVVVLYRDGWGQTPWTRIEETAIKNRAFDNGWDFFILINLDVKSCLPTWIPKTYIWLDFNRFKAEGAIAVIEQKVKETGGYTRSETIVDRAERLKRLRNAENEREAYLRSSGVFDDAKQEVINIISKLKEIKTQIEDPRTYLHLVSSERQNEMFEFGFDGYFIAFNCSSSFSYRIEDGKLRVILYEKSGHYGLDYKENIIRQQEYRFDRDLIGNNGWSDHSTGLNFQTSDELIDKWVKKFIDDISKRRN